MTPLHMTLAEVAAACASDGAGLPMPPNPNGERHFSEPWQAHAFALTLLLHQKGVFSWVEWAETLAARIRLAQAGGDPDDGTSYYRHWMDALEQLMITRGIATADQLHALEHAWAHAAEHTPHGQPIELPSVQDDASAAPSP
jgi:nitrile hydratase accessory protein